MPSHSGYPDQRFRQRLRARKYDKKQLKALLAITPGAAWPSRTCPPAEIIGALRIYDLALDPLLKKLRQLRTGQRSLRPHLPGSCFK